MKRLLHPEKPVHDGVHVRVADAKPFSERTYLDAAGMKLSGLKNLLFRKLPHWMLFAAHPSLANRVLHVVFLRSEKQVVRSNAKRIVALVKNLKGRIKFAVVDTKRHARSQIRNAFSVANRAAIPVVARGSSGPVPAGSLVVNTVNILPESDFHWSHLRSNVASYRAVFSALVGSAVGPLTACANCFKWGIWHPRILLVSTCLIPALVLGQGVTLPYVQQQFFNATGAPLANGFVCTLAAGTTTPLATYSNSSLTTANQNPVRLNSAGRPQSNLGVEVQIFLRPEAYKILVYASGTGNTCNGTVVGSLISTRDNVTAWNAQFSDDLSVDGDVTVTDQLISSVATGTAPIVVTSTTPVDNLTGHPEAYNAAGTQRTNVQHVFGTVALVGGTASVTFAGGAVFSGTNNFVCNANDETAAAAVRVIRNSASSISLAGTTTDTIAYHCVGY